MIKENQKLFNRLNVATDAAAAFISIAAAYLLVFSLLYTPCIAAVASVRRELGGKWAAGLAVWQCLIAWVAAFVTHGIGSLLL